MPSDIRPSPFRDSPAMWAAVLLGSIVGIASLALIARTPWQNGDIYLGGITKAGVGHWLLMTIIVTATVSLVSAPFIRFLASGWKGRLDEFKSRLRGGAIIAYLSQFWQLHLDNCPAANTSPAAAEALVTKIYISQYGRRDFAVPVLLLLVVTFLSAVLVVQTGIDTCVERGCVSGAAVRVGSRFAPLGDLTLPKASVAALGGAYLFVVGDAILRARRRTMNVSDVYWYGLRMLVAIPLGLAFAETTTPALASLVSFGLGAFPMDSLLRMLRRLTSKTIGAGEDEQEPDQLVQLAGVTVPISVALAAEGVESIDELVGVDPVLLSIRSGIPFPSVLRFASQAVVRLHLGDKAKQLEPLGLANAYLVAQLIADLDSQRGQALNPAPAEQRLLDAVKLLKNEKDQSVPSNESVEACFRQISLHGYTAFLRAMD